MTFVVDDALNKEITLSENGNPVLTYHYSKTVSHPYMHPIYTSNGQIVTEGFGDNKQRHLPGLCFSVGEVKDKNGNASPIKQKVTEIDKEVIRKPKSSNVFRIVSETTYQISNAVLINTLQIDVPPIRNDVRILDMKVVLQALSKPIELVGDIGLSYYAVEMEHRKTANANAKIGEAEVNRTESKWGTLCGIVDNTAIGVAICPHPANGPTQFIAEDVYQGFLFAKTPSLIIDPHENRELIYRVLIYLGDLFTFDVGEYYSH
ncbi:hypothetical protein F4083_01785 [Candidatus Poribacteria bacterium]|nr:hypothetical protein [Candidatus Poribacteria bacterium]MYF57219.1 hypothetical protein [Candidatus Poribacteria bacterium]MYI93045.1 hypothetical protein [Candidatus Poribacteria bacterium]